MGLFDSISNMLESQLSHPTVLDKNNALRKKEDIPTKFNLNRVKVTCGNLYILYDIQDIKNAAEDILSLNTVFAEAHKLCKEVPKKTIKQNNMHFTERQVNGTNVFNFLRFTPLTKTGKISKHPVILHFNISENFFGELYYSQDCAVDKARITIWKKDDCYEIVAKNINNKLAVNTIYTFDIETGKKIKIFDIKE